MTSDQLAQRRALGRRIRTWRLRRDLSQARLAELAGVTQSSLSHYENGKRDPSISTLLKIAQELDVALEASRGVLRVLGLMAQRTPAASTTPPGSGGANLLAAKRVSTADHVTREDAHKEATRRTAPRPQPEHSIDSPRHVRSVCRAVLPGSQRNCKETRGTVSIPRSAVR